ncbi:MAG: hypothetical protein V5A64_06800 [Candidatus Thermoplasmatota archaeon]
MNKKIMVLLLSLLFLIPVFNVGSSEISETKKNDNSLDSRPVVKVAIIRQYWDPLDVLFTAKLSTLMHRICLKKAQNDYNVRFRIYEFWDNYIFGDVQAGLLQLRDIDIVIAPGGMGGWQTPFLYRWQLKRFVKSGGGFYGICGDSTFGSLGTKHLKWQYRPLLDRLLGYELSPMLKLANVYTDASAFRDLIKNPLFFNKLSVLFFLVELPQSRATIHFEDTSVSIQEPYIGEDMVTMLGNAPMIEGPLKNKLFMSEVHTIATIKTADKPYGDRIKNKKAIVATTYGEGRVVLSCIHSQLTWDNSRLHDVYVRNVLWTAGKI